MARRYTDGIAGSASRSKNLRDMCSSLNVKSVEQGHLEGDDRDLAIIRGGQELRVYERIGSNDQPGLFKEPPASPCLG
jgi:hypothetical protein